MFYFQVKYRPELASHLLKLYLLIMSQFISEQLIVKAYQPLFDEVGGVK